MSQIILVNCNIYNFDLLIPGIYFISMTKNIGKIYFIFYTTIIFFTKFIIFFIWINASIHVFIDGIPWKWPILIAVKSSLKSEVQENGDSEKSGDKQEKSEEENSDSSKRTSDSDKSESLGEGAIENVDEIMV